MIAWKTGNATGSALYEAARVVRRRLRMAMFRANFHAGRYRGDVVWLIGDGRSGTTWAAGLLNGAGEKRVLFEPFHPWSMPGAEERAVFAYRRPGMPDPWLERAAEAVFTGRMTNRRVDWGNGRVLYRGLVVKDVLAGFLARWVVERHAHVRPVLLVRHPFAVARSKRDHADWYWPIDPGALLDQPELMADHLEPCRAALAEAGAAGDPFLSHLAVWAAVHRVLFAQFGPGELPVLFYEDLVRDARGAMAALPEGIAPRRIEARRIERPSQTSGRRSVAAARGAPEEAATRGLDMGEIARGRALLEAFGLADLYGEDGMPDRAALARFPIGGG